MFIKIIKPGVTDGSSVLDVGTVVEYPDAVAESLVNDGYAVATGDDSTDNGDSGDLTPETAAKKLNKFKVDKLVALAIEHGVEVADDATKADIIAAIIAADVYADILG